MKEAANRQWIVAQIGAREHYAVARALQARDQLGRLYTEFWAGGNPVIARAPGPLRALANRAHPDVPAAKVTAFNAATLSASAKTLALAKLGRRAGGTDADYREFARIGRDFARRCVRDMSRRGVSAESEAFFGYNTGCLETLKWLEKRGVPTVVGQIDPGRVEEDLVRAEAEKWPGWAASSQRIPELYYYRLEAEWQAASRVLVNSSWSRDALIKQGVAPAKIIVVPLAYEAPDLPDALRNGTFDGPESRDDKAPLQVLWLGSVMLRKGIQYLLEAAILLQKTDVRFVVAGPIYIGDDKVANAPANVEFVGRVERDQVAALYRGADVFVLPTLSDGFAITQLEAMAHGLPVVTTPRCGEVVTAGVDGEIVPVGDAQALSGAILSLNQDREKLRAMKIAAREKSRQFSLERFATGLNAAIAGAGPI